MGDVSTTGLRVVLTSFDTYHAATGTRCEYVTSGKNWNLERMSKTVLSRVISNILYKRLLTFINSK